MSGAYLVAVVALACGVLALAIVAVVLLRAVRALTRVKSAATTVFAHDVGLLRARKAALAVALRQHRDSWHLRVSPYGSMVDHAEPLAVGTDGGSGTRQIPADSRRDMA